MSSLLPEHLRPGGGVWVNAAGLTSAVEGLGARPSVKVAAVPPIRSLTMHPPSGPSYMPACGESGVVDFASQAQAHFQVSIPLTYTTCGCHDRVLPATRTRSSWRWSLGECRGIDFRGRGSGCQTLSKGRSGPPNTFAHDASALGPVVHAGMRREWRSRLRQPGSGSFPSEHSTDLHNMWMP